MAERTRPQATSDRLEIDPESVKEYRQELREMVRGNALGEAAVEGFTDWGVVEAFERMLAVAKPRDGKQPS
jgi:hypothetical protein